jgi:general secretion pathway protein G
MVQRRLDDYGLTLIEIMVVIVILGILATLIIPRIMGREEQAKRVKARVDIESLETALKLYKLDNGTYPTTEQGLQSLVEAPTVGQLPRNWREGGYLEKNRIPKDPWGYDYLYLSPGVHGDFDVMCREW